MTVQKKIRDAAVFAVMFVLFVAAALYSNWALQHPELLVHATHSYNSPNVAIDTTAIGFHQLLRAFWSVGAVGSLICCIAELTKKTGYQHQESEATA